MRKSFLMVTLLSILLIGASTEPVKLIRLTVINKAGLGIEISMTGKYQEGSYYLRVPEGDRSSPTLKVFTIIPDIYSMQVYYDELWDPVYGYSCSSRSQSVDATRTTKIVFLECTLSPPNVGEPPSIIKFGRSIRISGPNYYMAFPNIIWDIVFKYKD